MYWNRSPFCTEYVIIHINVHRCMYVCMHACIIVCNMFLPVNSKQESQGSYSLLSTREVIHGTKPEQQRIIGVPSNLSPELCFDWLRLECMRRVHIESTHMYTHMNTHGHQCNTSTTESTHTQLQSPHTCTHIWTPMVTYVIPLLFSVIESMDWAQQTLTNTILQPLWLHLTLQYLFPGAMHV